MVPIPEVQVWTDGGIDSSAADWPHGVHWLRDGTALVGRVAEVWAG